MDAVQKTKQFLETFAGRSLFSQAMATYGLPTRAYAFVVMMATGIRKSEEVDRIVREVMK